MSFSAFILILHITAIIIVAINEEISNEDYQMKHRGNSLCARKVK